MIAVGASERKEAKELLIKRPLDKWLLIVMIGGVIVTLGVAGELGAQAFLSTAESGLRNANHQYVALLEHETTGLKAANLALEAQIQPRRLTKKDLPEIVSALAPFKGRAVKVSSAATDIESAVLAHQVVQALKLAGIVPFDRSMTRQVLGGIGFGVLVSGPNKPLVDALVLAFAKSLDAAAGDTPGGITTILPAGEDAIATEATVFIGVKPLANWPDWP